MRCASPSTIAVLPTPGLADQHRVVLLAPGEHLDRRLDLLGAPDHRIELAFAGELGQVARILVEVRRVGRRLDPALLGAAADDLDHLLADRLRREPVAAQQVAGDAFVLLGEADQEMLRADIGVAEARARRRKRGRGAFYARRDADLAALFRRRLSPRGALLFELAAQLVDARP